MQKVLENIGKGTELAKRCYLEDTIISMKCRCGEVLKKDLSSDYLPYPVVGHETNLYFYCDECDSEYENEVSITLSINAIVEYKDEDLIKI